MRTYSEFLESKYQYSGESGFAPLYLPDLLFDFQRHLIDWSLRRGRSAIFADCGLGKTLMQLVWSENVVRHTNGRVLILTPIAVGRQTVAEADKFGITQAAIWGSPDAKSSRVHVANYERLHLISPDDYVGVVCDESSILKNFDGKTKDAVVEFMRKLPYRLLCTATAAPNDYTELGNSSEALGELGFQDMVSKFFKKETSKDHLGWGRVKYQMRGHAREAFWRWVCSWARACRKPSDLGFADTRFVLPELVMREHPVHVERVAEGRLFDVPAVSLAEQREEQRRSLKERCEKVAALVAETGKPAVCWCQLNDEGDLLEALIPDAEQVSGKDSEEAKERKLLAFAKGEIRVLVTKPKIAGFGLNWQHCAHQTYFPSHSFEQWYQGVRRSWRFGQSQPVTVDIVTTEGGAGVLANLKRKQEQADAMFAELVSLMNDSLKIERTKNKPQTVEFPKWLRQ